MLSGSPLKQKPDGLSIFVYFVYSCRLYTYIACVDACTTTLQGPDYFAKLDIGRQKCEVVNH